MKASTLLLYISACIAGQLALAVAFALVKRKFFKSAVQMPNGQAGATVGDATRGLQNTAQTPSAWAGLRAFNVVRREFEDAAQTQCSFYLAPQDGVALPDFKPGQFLTFQLSMPQSADEPARTLIRCYSLSDAPSPQQYRITVKKVAAGIAAGAGPAAQAGVCSNYLHSHVQVGDTLQVRAPSGHFYLDTASQDAVVLIGGGIGITPMMSMLRWCLQHQPQRHIYLFLVVRNAQEHAFKPLLAELAAQALQFHLHVVYSRPLPGDEAPRDYQHAGHINIDLLKATLPHGTHQFYLCGPGALLESLVPALSDWGVAAKDIHFEAFGPSSVRSPAARQDATTSTQPLEIQFSKSGRTLQWSGKEDNLLEFAEQHGIDIDSGCRSGSCGACATTLVSGTVAYDNPPDHDCGKQQCLMCVGKPRTALVLEA